MSQQKRLFHVVTAFITLFATLSYFAMATGDGVSYHHIINKIPVKNGPDLKVDIYRQIFWARYVDWTVTTPLLLLDLAFLAGLNGSDIIVAIVADIVMVLTGMFGAFGINKTQKWGWFAMGCVAYLVVVALLAVNGRKTAAAKNARTARFFAAIGGFTLVLWTLYPVVWGFGDGARILDVDGEIIAYAILDVMAKPVFGFWLLLTHAKSDSTSIGGWWSHGIASEGALRLDEDEGA
jgi:bacteriorhodopsin